MESVTDCWLCRLDIDLSGERCFSQAATVLWKPQERRGKLVVWGELWEEVKIKHWCCTLKFERGRMTILKKKRRWRKTDTRQKVQTRIMIGIRLCATLLQIGRPRGRNSMLQRVALWLCYNIWISDQQAERDRMSPNLKLLAAIDLGAVLARPCVGKERGRGEGGRGWGGGGHPFCENGSQYCWSGNWALI